MAAGRSGIVAEMLKAAGAESVVLARQLTEAVSAVMLSHQTERRASFWTFIRAFDRGNYHGLKLTDQLMKLLERVSDFYIQDRVNIDEMQFGFVPGSCTIDAFVVRQLQEKYIKANKLFYFVFVDLKKSFDHVPEEALWWALRGLIVEEWAVRLIQCMYSNAQSRAWFNGQYSEEFGVGAGVLKGFVLSPPLFILVLNVLLLEFRIGVPWDVLYADDWCSS